MRVRMLTNWWKKLRANVIEPQIMSRMTDSLADKVTPDSITELALGPNWEDLVGVYWDNFVITFILHSVVFADEA